MLLSPTTISFTALALLASCSSDAVSVSESVTAPQSTTPPSATPLTTNSPPAAASDGGGTLPTPVRSAESEVAEGTNWLAHGRMSENEIELIWSEVEGQTVLYRLYRFESSDNLDLDAVALDSDSQVFEGNSTYFTDSSFAPGFFYTYFLTVDVDGTSLTRRWTTALAVNDTEPPTPIKGLEATTTSDGVLLTWDESNDKVEFASYSVSKRVDGELIYLGGGTEPEQASFLDNRPEPGQALYVVQAVDFHDNRTAEASVEYES